MAGRAACLCRGRRLANIQQPLRAALYSALQCDSNAVPLLALDAALTLRCHCCCLWRWVQVVVATTFNELVLGGKKDVLIEFYAPWCAPPAPCTRLHLVHGMWQMPTFVVCAMCSEFEKHFRW